MTASDKEYLKSVGKNIAKLRKERGLSQSDVCYTIGMDKSNLSTIENGNQNITALTVKRIAEAIGVPPVEIYKI